MTRQCGGAEASWTRSDEARLRPSAGKMPADPPPLLLVKNQTFLWRRRGLKTARKADPPKREERWRTRTPWAPPTACTTVSRAGESTHHGHHPRNVRQPAEEQIGEPSPPPTHTETTRTPSARTRSDDDGTKTACLKFPECLLTQTMRGTMSPSLHLPVSASPQVTRGRRSRQPQSIRGQTDIQTQPPPVWGSRRSSVPRSLPGG